MLPTAVVKSMRLCNMYKNRTFCISRVKFPLPTSHEVKIGLRGLSEGGCYEMSGNSGLKTKCLESKIIITLWTVTVDPSIHVSGV